MKLTTLHCVLLVIASMAIQGCQADDPLGGPAPLAERRAPGPDEVEPVPAPTPTGTISIDGTTWTVVPNVQCSIFPGPVVSIAGHAEADESIEITIDHDADRGPTAAIVVAADGSIDWRAGGDSLVFEIDGLNVKGVGDFLTTVGGSPRTVQGSFEVNCR